MPNGVRAVILGLLIIVLLIAGSDTLLALVAGLAPLAFSGGENRPDPTTADELDDFRDRLHVVQSDAWRRGRPGRKVAADDWWGIADVPVPLVERWPVHLVRPDLAAKLPQRQGDLHARPEAELVPELLRDLTESEYNLLVHGPKNSGKTATLLGFFLAAQECRNDDPEFPLAIRVSLAGWNAYWSHPDRRDAVAEPALIDWIKVRFREDFPGLLEHGSSADDLLEALWRDDSRAGGSSLMLFVDDLADVTDRQHWKRLMEELSSRTVMLAHPTADPTPAEQPDVSSWPGTWEILRLARPTRADAERILGGPTDELPPDFLDSPRLLTTLRGAYPTGWRQWLAEAPNNGVSKADRLWQELIARGWRSPAEGQAPEITTTAALRTLTWVTRADLFGGQRFAWWAVPRLAAERNRDSTGDPLVRRAYHRVRLRRANSTLVWALATFGAGLLVLILLLLTGVIQGYDQAGHGLASTGRLTAEDVRQWRWSGWDSLLSNPAYLSVLVAGMVTVTVHTLAMFGDEFEHRAGGRPQTIRPRLPVGADLRDIAAVVPRRSAVLVACGLGSAGLTQVLQIGPAGQLWAGTAFAGLFVCLLAWLHWCSQEGDNLTPADTFDSDRRSTAVVAVALGSAALVASTTLSWWFTSPMHRPTLGQSLWIIAAAATSAGLARAFYLGAGMIAPLLFQLRPGFGVGYAERMRLLEDELRRQDVRNGGQPTTAVPIAVISVFDLDRKASWEAERDRGLVLRQIGSLIRLRDITLDHHLRNAVPHLPVAKPPDRVFGSRALRSGALVVSTLLALLSLTGATAVVLPRVACSPWQDLEPLPGSVPDAQTWLENGQCVGFETLKGNGNRFARLTGASGEPEAERNKIMTQIEQQNAAIPDPERAVNILFLAPLSRTADSNAINALYQLDGARAAQAAINRSGSVFVRLIVANTGEDFTSGPSVVQIINRKFPTDLDDPGSIKAVTGIAQSRSAAREALAQFDGIPLVAGAITGNDMRHGLIRDQDVDLGENFVSVSPSNAAVARAMVDEHLLERAGPDTGSSGSTGQITLRIIRDSSDTFFSNDLANSLTEVTGSADLPTGYVARDPVDLHETDPTRRYQEVADELCAPESDRTIWLFAGRGNQLARLDSLMPAGCTPAVIAGPGATSAIQSASQQVSPHWADLHFSSLVNRSPGWLVDQSGPGGLPWSTALARSGDVSIGWAALVEAYQRILPTGVIRCPETDPGIDLIGMEIPDGAEGDGHNTLGPGGRCGAPEGTHLYFCPVSDTQPLTGEGCLASTVPAARTDD